MYSKDIGWSLRNCSIIIAAINLRAKSVTKAFQETARVVDTFVRGLTSSEKTTNPQPLQKRHMCVRVNSVAV